MMHQTMFRGMKRVFHYPGEFFSHHYLNIRLVREPHRIQELDGGFFERFGSLGQKEQQAAPEDDPEPPQDDVEEEAVKKEIKKDLLAEAIGLNIDELYLEVLYEVIHTVGCMKELGEQEVLLQYLQKAFRMDTEKHQTLLEQARSKEPPNILLNVQIVEAKELPPKDANGLSDPFCTLYLSSDPRHRYNTSVKEQTLSPIWEEHFSLPIDTPSDESLCIEVWDFDPAETVREKMTKFTDVKGVKGFRKLIKEIAVTASTGKHDNEFIGNAIVQLKNIPATGQIMWVNLEKKNKVRRQGIVRVKIAFSTEKNSQAATQEHRHLLRIFAMHEIEALQSEEGVEWNGGLSAAAESILQQHVAQSSMTETDEALAKWVAYAAINTTHAVSCAAFHSALQKLIRPINNGLLTDEEFKSFWDAAKKMLPSCFKTIKKLRKLPPAEKSTTTLLTNTLSILSTLNSMQLPKGLDLFPQSVYGWLTRSTNCDIRSVVEEAITQAAVDWFIHLTDHSKPEDSSEKSNLKHKINIVRLIKSDLQKAIEFHEKLFVTMIQVSYAKTLYTIFECKVSEMTEPLVNDICASLKPLRYKDNSHTANMEDDPLALGTSLFELYIELQRLSVLGTAICPSESDNFHITRFHTWFHRGVAHWLDIAVYKAMHRIQRAVELDELIPIDSTVRYSSSAVDTLHIYHQIKTFWQQLSWPDVEGSYTFVAKIMDDICRCSDHYADIMASRVEKMGETQTVYQKKFEVTNEWCLAINNIDYVRQSIQPFVKELGLDDIIKKLAEFQSHSAAEHCRETLQLVLDNAVETVKNKILDLLETVVEKMSPAIRRFLMEGAELADQENNSVDRLMQYLDENLTTLGSQLNPDNFDRILNITFNKLANIMYELVENGLEKRKPPPFFANLHKTLHVLMGFFRQGENNQNNNNEMMSQIERLLTLHGMDTPELVMQVHIARLEEQRKMATTPMGLLTVRLQFVHDTLRLEVLNARNLKPLDSNGSSDPYVKIHLLPEELFADVKRPRTKAQKQNLFPLFDETFTIQLTREQRQAKDAMLLFMVKDQDYFGVTSQFLGEAYFPFSEIPTTTMETNLREMQQTHLKLSKPTESSLECDAMKALDHRQGEKLAKDFIKRQRSKHNHSNVPS
ncbi:protein unc-13 homolog 4B-like isoform X2 [Macrosteles quadrilineatus]|uniref:protein unc-13 homolog 4B-like isoform X2 n=1 Tax=Macrosteles quadrilineatus TaxID=74068 RepID=UPI0023E20CEC|nr:protein unc-13 homolog 4B-like isoform X2 [Macrosteles quadrilineatus]